MQGCSYDLNFGIILRDLLGYIKQFILKTKQNFSAKFFFFEKLRLSGSENEVWLRVTQVGQ